MTTTALLHNPRYSDARPPGARWCQLSNVTAPKKVGLLWGVEPNLKLMYIAALARFLSMLRNKSMRGGNCSRCNPLPH